MSVQRYFPKYGWIEEWPVNLSERSVLLTEPLVKESVLSKVQSSLAEREQRIARYEAALQRISALDPDKDSKEGFNEWGEADCFNQAQTIARAALATEGEKRE